MARTPLLRQLQQIARTHFLASREDKPVHAIQEALARASEARRHDVSRRRFLGGVAGVTTAAAIAGVPRIAHAAGQPRIAIVGGGIAGLNCALTLADVGVASTIYESSGRIGGRMFSNTTYWDQGQVTEWAGELIDTGHKKILELCRRFNLPVDDVLQAEVVGSEPVYYFFGQHYPRSQAIIDFKPVKNALVADTQAAGYPTTWDANTPGGRALDNLSLYDWIETRVPGGHSSPLGMLLDVAYEAEYGALTRDQSSLNLVYLLGYNASPGNFSIWGQSDERYHIRGGNQRLPAAIAASLQGSISSGWALESLRTRSDGAYDLSFRVSGSSRSVIADHVVLALPFAVLRELDIASAGFDMLKHRAIQNLGRGRNGKLAVQTTRRMWNDTNSNGESFTDLPYQSTWEVTRSQAGTAGIMLNYSSAARTLAQKTTVPWGTIATRNVNADVQAFFAEANKVFPGLSGTWNGRATTSLPHLDPNLKLAYSYWRVGQCTSFAGYEFAPQGNIRFAGEHTSLDFQGWMEGGADTGARAGSAIATLLGRK